MGPEKKKFRKLDFIDLRDRSGLLQLVFDENNGEVFEKAKILEANLLLQQKVLLDSVVVQLMKIWQQVILK